MYEPGRRQARNASKLVGCITQVRVTGGGGAVGHDRGAGCEAACIKGAQH